MQGDTRRIEQYFAERFGRWNLQLPPESVASRSPGRIVAHGWHIAWLWGEQDGEEYLELFAQHRMTSDSYVRVWASARVEALPAPDSGQVILPGATEAEIAADRERLFARNRAIYAQLRDKGLLPAEGENLTAHEIHETLASGSVPPAPSQMGAGETVLKELDRDTLMAEAAEDAARGVAVGERASFLEKYLEWAMLAALGRYRGVHARARERLHVPGWDPQPGDVDLTVRFGAEPHPTVVAELKVDDVEATLWDLLKIAALVAQQPDAHGYLLAACPSRRWSKAECAALFPEHDQPCVWETAAIIERWCASWQWLLGGGRARPQRVPSQIETQSLARAPVAVFHDYELRCIAVRVRPEVRQTLLESGWPASESRSDSPPAG